MAQTQISCPNCRQVIRANVEQLFDATQDPQAKQRLLGGGSNMARCPHCAQEMESEDAILCLNCGYNTRSRQRVESKHVIETTPGEKFVWLLPGFICAALIPLLIGFDLFWTLALPRMVDKTDWEFLGREGQQLWPVVDSLFGMYFAGKFAVKRLILNSNPPETVVK